MKLWMMLLCLSFLVACPATENAETSEQKTENTEQKTAQTHENGKESMQTKSTATNQEHSHEGGEKHSHAEETKHEHKSPHGGILLDKDGEHWELVPHSDHIDFFLLDGNLKTISLQGASAELIIQGEKATRTIKLLPETENLMGKGVFDPKKETAILTLKRGDKTQHLRFGR